MSKPLPFQGTPEEAAANYETHRFIWSGPPEDAGDVRCNACDCRPGHQAAQYPCGADVPRTPIDDNDGEVILVEHTGTLEEFKAEMAMMREKYVRREEIMDEVDELLEPIREALIKLTERAERRQRPCPYCHGKSPSSDGLTECGWCDDGTLRHREWWMKEEAK